MTTFGKLFVGTAGIAAAVAFASPAAAQYYPNYGYGYNNGGIVGAIVNSVVGGNQYGYGNNGGNDRFAVDQCTRAVQQRLGGGYGYNNGYNGGGRILGITSVERKNSGLRVRGVASAGGNYGGGYGYNNAGANLTFSCKVNYNGRITDIDLDRQNYGYNNYNGYRRGY